MYSIGTRLYFKYLTLDLQLILNYLQKVCFDIKVLDDATKVADIEKKVLDFLKVPDNPQNRNTIFVIDVEYAIICARHNDNDNLAATEKRSMKTKNRLNLMP